MISMASIASRVQANIGAKGQTGKIANKQAKGKQTKKQTNKARKQTKGGVREGKM